MKGKNRNRFLTDEICEPKGHPQFYRFDFGAPANEAEGWDECWVSAEVKARSPEKARKKIRRLQIKLGWPLIRFEGAPRRTSISTEEDHGPRTRWSKAHHRWQTFRDGRWVNNS